MAYAIPKHCQLRQYPFSVQFLLKNGALLWEPCAFGACGMRGVRGAPGAIDAARGAPGEHRAPIHYLCVHADLIGAYFVYTHPHPHLDGAALVVANMGLLNPLSHSSNVTIRIGLYTFQGDPE